MQAPPPPHKNRVLPSLSLSTDSYLSSRAGIRYRILLHLLLLLLRLLLRLLLLLLLLHTHTHTHTRTRLFSLERVRGRERARESETRQFIDAGGEIYSTASAEFSTVPQAALGIVVSSKR